MIRCHRTIIKIGKGLFTDMKNENAHEGVDERNWFGSLPFDVRFAKPGKYRIKVKRQPKGRRYQ